MICTQCEGEIPQGAAECPHCGAAVVITETVVTGPTVADILSTPAAPGGPASAPGSGVPSAGGASAFNFDAKRLTQADRIAGVATVVLFISLFLPWFSISFAFVSASASGVSAHGYLYIVLLICLAILAYLVVRAGFHQMPFQIPGSHESVLLIATVVNLVLVLIGFIDKPGGGGVGWSFGAFLALVAAVAAAAPLALPIIQSRSKSAS